MHLFQRQSKDCEKGVQWYVCTANNFSGCCSVNPCHLANCPDTDPSKTVTLAIQGGESTSTVSTAVTALSAKSPSMATTTSSSLSGSAPTTTSQVTSEFSAAKNIAVKTSASDISTPTERASSGPSSSSKAPIIAGSVGVVALSIVAILVWYCMRRRRLQGQSKAISKSPFRESKDPYTLERNFDEEQHLQPNDVFAPFREHSRSPSLQASRISNESTSSQQTLNLNPTPQSSQEDTEDAPLPDVEKSSVTPPPMTEHPALHLHPGQSPENPAYHPGGAIASPDLAQHPAYLQKHPSLMSKHPALQSSKTEPIKPPSHSFSESHPTFTFSAAGPSSPVAATKPISNGCSMLSPQPKSRKHSISRTSSIHSPNNPPYQPTYTLPTSSSLTSSTKSQNKHSIAPYKSLSLQPLEQPTTRSLLENSSLPTLHAGTISTSPIELPAVVPQELDGATNPHLLSRGASTTTIATQASTYSIPIGLGFEPSSFSNQKCNILEPVMERGSVSEAGRSPGFPPSVNDRESEREQQHMMSASTSPGDLSPQFYPSPRSAVSPDIRSPHYSPYYAISSPAPKTPAQGFMSFASNQQQYAVAETIPLTSSPARTPTTHNPNQTPPTISSSPPAPRKASPSPPPPKINTNSLPPMKKPLSRSPILRQKQRAKSSLGIGKEHVMAWATYRYHSGTPSSPLSSISKSSSQSRLAENPGNGEGDESPVMENGYAKVENGDGEGEDEMGEMEMDARSPRTRGEEERWSGSTAAMSTSASRVQSQELSKQKGDEAMELEMPLNQMGTPF